MLSADQALVKIDVDRANPPTVMRLVRLCDRAGVTINWLRQSRSPGGKGWHIVLDVAPRPRSAMEVVALQTVLGSDPWREAVSVQRARMFPTAPGFMRDRWNVLYTATVKKRRISLVAIQRRRKARRSTSRPLK